MNYSTMAIFTGSLIIDLLGLVTAFIAVGFTYLKWKHQYWKIRGLPYIKPTIPFGNFENPYRRTISLSDKFIQMYKEAKSKGWKHFGIYMMATPMYFVTDLEIVKCIMTRDFQHFVDRGIYTNEKDNPIGCHLFALGGKKWRNLRVKLTPTFTSGKLKAMFQTLIDCGLALEQCIEEHIDTKEAVDIKNVLGCFTTDVIGTCAFGLECNSFKEPNSPFRIYGSKFLTTTKLQSLRNLFSANFPNLARALGVPSVSKEISDFYTKVVEETVAYREQNNYSRNDFLQLLIDMKNKREPEENELEGDEKALTMNQIVAQSFIFFIGGYETSSTTMTFALFELASHQDIQDKVREEINTVLERHENKITYDALTEMKYMSQVIDDNALSENELAELLEDDDFWTEMDGDDNEEKGSALYQILNSGDTSDRDEEDHEIFSDHDSESEVEADPNEDGEEVDDLTDSTSKNSTTSASSRALQPHRGWYGKDKTKWSKEAPSGRKTLSHNIITVLPGLKGPARQNRPTSPLEAWKLLFTDDMIQIIVQFTNIKIDEIKVNYSKFKTRRNSRRKYLPTFIQNTDEMEIRAFIGLLYMQGVFKSGHEDLKSLWATDGTETLRLFPPLGVITRVCCEDYKVPGEDIIIEKGVRVGIPIKAIHYDEEYFKNPEVFDPERFNEENNKNI
ncbi:hypothetical protein NQ314_009513, partial [Rhamnusium bicolor]